MMLTSALVLIGFNRPAMALDVGDLIVTEFMAFPAVADYYGEWFEIYNASSGHINFADDPITIKDRSGESIRITSGIISRGSYMVFGVNSNPSLTGGVTPDVVYDHADFDMEYTGDEIIIQTGSTIVDEVDWNGADWEVTRGAALQVNPPATLEWANDLAHNWCPSEAFMSGGSYGTPSEANELCEGSSIDHDGDGYTEVAGDCDDEDSYVNPDAIDGDGGCYGDADDDADCDGRRDDGLSDDDLDGLAEVEGDCDDEQSTVYPDRAETPDGLDNDCNTCIDDTDGDSDGWTTCRFAWAQDDDGCWTLSSVDRYDCEDADRGRNPDATEIPYDDIDQDCDGFDECDADDDGYRADSTHGLGFCGGNDCDDEDPTSHPNGTEGDPEAGGVPDGHDNDCNGIIDDPYLDVDGDGYTVTDGDCLDVPESQNPRSVDVHPSAEEVCNDLLDNDCDGYINEGCTNVTAYAALRGGGMCGVVGRSATSLSALLLLLAALVRRRSRGVEETQR